MFLFFIIIISCVIRQTFFKERKFKFFPTWDYRLQNLHKAQKCVLCFRETINLPNTSWNDLHVCPF